MNIIKKDDDKLSAQAAAAQQLAEESKLPVAEEQPPVEGDSVAEADTKMQVAEEGEQKMTKDAPSKSAASDEDVTSKQ